VAKVIFASLHQCAPYLIHASLDPSDSRSQTAFLFVQTFLHRYIMTYIMAGSPYVFTMGSRLSPSKLPFRTGGSVPTPNTRFQHRFCKAHNHDRPTDHATRSVTICRICVQYVVLRRGLIIQMSVFMMLSSEQKGTARVHVVHLMNADSAANPQTNSLGLCGGEQRAPPMFRRATITFGIGPHF